MLQKEYIESMQQRYLVIESAGDKKNELQEKMLIHNTPEGLLKFELRNVDNTNYYYYDVGGMQTLESIFEKNPPNSIRLHNILSAMIAAILKGTEYFLEEDDFIISPEYIFWSDNAEQDAIRLCYYPGYGKNLREQLQTFFEGLMNIIDYKDDKAVVYVYGMYRKTQETGCTFDYLLQDIIPGQEIGNNDNLIIGNSKLPDKASEVVQVRQSDAYNDLQGTITANTNKNPYQVRRSRVSPSMYSSSSNSNPYNNSNGNQKLSYSQKLNNNQKSKINYNKEKSLFGKGYSTVIAAGVAMLIVLLYALSNNMFIYPNGRIEYNKLIVVTIVVAGLGVFIAKCLLNLKNRKAKPDANMTEERVTAFLSEDKETVLISTGSPICYYLEEQADSRTARITPNRFPYYIGSSSTHADCVINADTVSRRHAMLEQQGDELYITDTNSKNGTFVNDGRLCPEEKVRLLPDDLVKFANKTYMVKRM